MENIKFNIMHVPYAEKFAGKDALINQADNMFGYREIRNDNNDVVQQMWVAEDYAIRNLNMDAATFMATFFVGTAQLTEANIQYVTVEHNQGYPEPQLRVTGWVKATPEFITGVKNFHEWEKNKKTQEREIKRLEKELHKARNR